MAAPTNPPLPAILYGNAVPTSGYYTQGTIIINNEPGNGNVLGWICTADGTPGTWSAMPLVTPTTLTTVATAGATLTAGTRFALLTPTTASSYTLPLANLQSAGFVLTAINLGGAVAQTLAAPSGNTLVGGAIATTTANARLSVLSDGNTTWYNVT